MKAPKTLYSWVQFIMLFGGIFIGFGMVFYNFSGYEMRLFPTIEDRIHTIDHVNGIEEFVKGLNADKKERDTLQKLWIQGLVEMSKLRGDMNRRDSLMLDINIRKANTEYEAKKNTDSIIRLWNNYNEEN